MTDLVCPAADPAGNTDAPRRRGEQPANKVRFGNAVIVDLFHSEGCSGCPPVENVINQVAKQACVVRAFASAPLMDNAATVTLAVPAELKPENAWLIAYLQDPASMRVVTANGQPYVQTTKTE